MKVINNNKRFQILLQLIADIIAVWLGFAIQLYLRFFSGLIDTIAEPTFIDYISGSFLMTFFWLTIFLLFGMYKEWYVRSPFSEFYSIIKISLFGCFIIVFLIFTSNNTSLIRVLFLVYFAISVFTFTFFRFLIRRIQIKLRKKGIIKIPILIVGKLKPSIEFYIDALKCKTWGYDVRGIILYENEKNNDTYDTITPIICTEKNDIENIIQQLKPAEIVLSAGIPESKELFLIEEICIKYNIKLSIFPNLYDHFTGRTKTQNLYGVPLIEVSFRVVKPLQYVVKRMFDIVFSLIVLIVGIPIWIIIAIIIRLETEGNPIYSQKRVGRNNKIFTIYKFRSMKKSADKKQQWAQAQDPRVTKVGKILRKTHLDEMPQFFNILIGDMSVVGPRPEQPILVEEFAAKLKFYNRRHLIRPGLTGWNQILRPVYDNNFNEVKLKTKNDFWYIENFSLGLDVEIVVRTMVVVLTGRGQA